MHNIPVVSGNQSFVITTNPIANLSADQYEKILYLINKAHIHAAGTSMGNQEIIKPLVNQALAYPIAANSVSGNLTRSFSKL